MSETMDLGSMLPADYTAPNVTGVLGDPIDGSTCFIIGGSPTCNTGN